MSFKQGTSIGLHFQGDCQIARQHVYQVILFVKCIVGDLPCRKQQGPSNKLDLLRQSWDAPCNNSSPQHMSIVHQDLRIYRWPRGHLEYDQAIKHNTCNTTDCTITCWSHMNSRH